MLFKQKERIKSLMKFFFLKKVWIIAKRLHSYLLNLKSKVWNQGEEDGGYNHYLIFLEKRAESRNFIVFLCFLGEKYDEKREKKCPKTLPKTQNFNSGPI